MLRQAKRKIFLIVDGHPVHRSEKAKAWLEKNAERIDLFVPPGYSPEPNRDEMLDRDVKANAVGRRRARTQPELMQNASQLPAAPPAAAADCRPIFP